MADKPHQVHFFTEHFGFLSFIFIVVCVDLPALADEFFTFFVLAKGEICKSEIIERFTFDRVA